VQIQGRGEWRVKRKTAGKRPEGRKSLRSHRAAQSSDVTPQRLPIYPIAPRADRRSIHTSAAPQLQSTGTPANRAAAVLPLPQPPRPSHNWPSVTPASPLAASLVKNPRRFSPHLLPPGAPNSVKNLPSFSPHGSRPANHHSPNTLATQQPQSKLPRHYTPISNHFLRLSHYITNKFSHFCQSEPPSLPFRAFVFS